MTETKKCYPPSAAFLHGFSYEKAETYGKPGIGAHYSQKAECGHEQAHAGSCFLCGNRATNVHHWPRKSTGKVFTLYSPGGTYRLPPALFAICGTGATGCHGAWHLGAVDCRWIWDDDECAEMWWNGTLLHYFPPCDVRLYRFGFWRITYSGKTMEYRERPPQHDIDNGRMFVC